jgi:hypothetical protein
VHHLEFDKSSTQKRSREEVEEGSNKEEEEEEEEKEEDRLKIKRLVQTVNMDTFRYYLTRWIVERHLPFTVVEDDNFQHMLGTLNTTIKDHLVKSRTSIRN